MRYRLLALDCDGVLVGPDNVVPPATVEAVAAAEGAGLKICIATGRNYAETMPVWRQLRLVGPFQPLVLIGGALVSEPQTGRTLYHKPIPRAVACEFADALAAEGYCALAIVDAWRHGVDYYVTETGNVEEVNRRWLPRMPVTVRRVGSLWEASDMPACLRISAIIDPADGPGLVERFRQLFGDRLNVHSLVAPNYGVTIVEAFAAKADKFTAVQYVAQAWRIGRGQIVAVGDDVNDLPMIRGAGLGIVMPDAPEQLKRVADHVAGDRLPGIIEDLLAGRL